MNTKNSGISLNPWKVFWLTSAAVFLVSADATILFAAFPAIQQTFPTTSSAHLSWVLNAYTIVFAALLVAAGRMADIHGHRRIFLLGVGMFTVASALCGASPSPESLIAARVLQAVGAALLTPASLALVLGAFPAAQRPVAVALWGAVGALAAAVGPSAGSYIVDQWGWQYAFYINVPIGLITVVRGYRLLQEQRSTDASARPDVVGILLLVFGIGLLSLSVVQSEEWGILTATTLSTAAAGVLLLLVFIGWSRQSASPALDLSLFKNVTFAYVNLATFCFGITFTVMFFGFFMFLTKIWGYSLSLSGLAVTPGPLMVIPVAIITGKFAARIGHRAALVAGGIVFASSAAWLYHATGMEPQYLAAWLPGMLLSGLGVGMVLPSLSAAAAHGLPPNRFGVGVAVNTAIRQIGSVFGVAITVVLVGGKDVALADFQTLYLLLIAGGLITAVLCLPVNTRPRPQVAAATVASGL